MSATDWPAIFDSAEIDVVWAVIALKREDPRRSNREIARIAECGHPHVAKILGAFRDEPRAILGYLAQAGYLDVPYRRGEVERWPRRSKAVAA